MKILYENTSYTIEFNVINEDLNSVYLLTCSRPDLITITQDPTNTKRFVLDIGDINREDVLIEFQYTVIDSLGHTNVSKEIVVFKNTIDNDDRYYNKIETDDNFVNVNDYEDSDVIAKLLNTDTIGNDLNANYLDSGEPSLSPIENGIPIIDGEGKIPLGWIPYAPSLISFEWDEETHEVNKAYTLTINAVDFNGQDLSYSLIANQQTSDIEITIVQDETPNIFHVSYGPYDFRPYVEFTITITNEEGLICKFIDSKLLTLNALSPIIDDITWDINDHTDNHTYQMTINAHDPNDQILSYYVETSEPSIEIVQNPSYDNKFDITYPDFFENKTILFVITITNEDTLSAQRLHTRLVIDTIKVGDKGIFGGGFDGSLHLDIIEYITISTPGNATDFGDLSLDKSGIAACSNGSNDRGIFGGGYDGSFFNTIDYITISTLGDAIDFGNLTVARYNFGACSNGINDRGIFGNGNIASGIQTNVIDYVTISTPGDAADFGDLLTFRSGIASVSNGINDRGIFAGGGDVSNIFDIISYVTISTPGDAVDFGDLSLSRRLLDGCSNGINERGIFGGGFVSSISNVIDYITISTPGNAIDFGDLTIGRYTPAATSNGTDDRGVFGGGSDDTIYFDTIDYITISTPGDAIDFGDLTVNKSHMAACSDA